MKLIKNIYYMKPTKHLGSFRKNQQSKLFPPMTSSKTTSWNSVQSGSSNYFKPKPWLKSHNCQRGSQLILSHILCSLNICFWYFNWICHSETRKLDYISVRQKCEGIEWAVNLWLESQSTRIRLITVCLRFSCFLLFSPYFQHYLRLLP